MDVIDMTRASRKRAPPHDLSPTCAKLPRPNAPARHPALAPGTHVWLQHLVDLPHLNGEHCVFLSAAPAPGFALVRRACTNETVTVRAENLGRDAPDGTAACIALLARALGPEVAERILALSTCQRCWQPCEARTLCRVPHPAGQRTALRRGGCRHTHDEERVLDCYCNACHAMYQDFVERTGPDGRFPKNAREFEEKGLRSVGRGAGGDRVFDPTKLYDEFEYGFCFEGEHTIRPPRSTDKRVCVPPRVTLAVHCNPNIQAQLDALPDYVTSLRVLQHSSGPQHPFTNVCTTPRLHTFLPNLVHFETDLVNFRMASRVDGQRLFPKLQSCTSYNWDPVLERTWMKSILRSTKSTLEVLCLHNITNNTALTIGSNNTLKQVCLRNVASTALSLYAPQLRKLCVRGCANLSAIELRRDRNEKKVSSPPAHRPAPIQVNLKLNDDQTIAVTCEKGGRYPDVSVVESVLEPPQCEWVRRRSYVILATAVVSDAASASA